jgi:hypothetical protein
LPVPLAPDEMVIQDALLDAVQPQPDPVSTSNVPDPPDAGTDAFPDDSENVQPSP